MNLALMLSTSFAVLGVGLRGKLVEDSNSELICYMKTEKKNQNISTEGLQLLQED